MLLHFIFAFEEINIKFVSQASTRNIYHAYWILADNDEESSANALRKENVLQKSLF